MVAPFPVSTLTRSALWLRLPSTESARAFLEQVSALARSRGRLELSVAMLLAWLRRRDPLELGAVNWTAFCGQYVDWGAAWVRAMIRLVESPLDKVKEAVARGILPIRRAVAAPGKVTVTDQEVWLAEAVLGPAETKETRDLVPFSGNEASIIRRARHLGRLLLGWAAPAREVDAYIVRCWRDRVPLEQMLAAARTPPPPPPPPAAALVWLNEPEPRSVAEAKERLEEAQSALRGMTTVLARAWTRVTHERLYEEAGLTPEEAAEQILGMSHRSAQRLSKLGWGLEWYPEIDAAIQAGMAPRSAAALLEVAGDNDAPAWLDLAARVGRREFVRAVTAAREERSSVRTLARYRKAAELADRWAATAEGRAALERAAQFATGAADVGDRPVAEPVAEPTAGPATNAGAPGLGVALRHPAKPSGAPLRAPPELLAAATWFVEAVVLPPARGFARIKAQDDDRCTNPECGRRSLRTEAHHLIPRAQGGPDEAWNGTGACRVCHLRGLHGGHLQAVRVIVEGHDTVLWAWRDGRKVLRFRDEPGAPGAPGARG